MSAGASCSGRGSSSSNAFAAEFEAVVQDLLGLVRCIELGHLVFVLRVGFVGELARPRLNGVSAGASSR
jgi:hypothetical protein